jgi:hypothetical protein
LEGATGASGFSNGTYGLVKAEIGSTWPAFGDVDSSASEEDGVGASETTDPDAPESTIGASGFSNGTYGLVKAEIGSTWPAFGGVDSTASEEEEV